MSSTVDKDRCEQTTLVSAYALRALPASEVPRLEAHLSTCMECREELETLRPLIESFAAWPTAMLRPSGSLWDRLVERIAVQPEGETAAPVKERVTERWVEPQWEKVSPGISCKVLSTDSEKDRVTMLVRLAPGVSYPPHRHGGVEELHLLDGELWIDERKLNPGDYNKAESGTMDRRVWSETGCTCLLITSPSDELR